jgi:uncharacterized protein
MTSPSAGTTDAERAATGRPRRNWRRVINRVLVLYAAVPYLAVVVIFAALQRRFLYPATRTERLPAASIDSAGREVVDVEIHAANGVRLHGWHFHTAESIPGAQRLIIYFPGNSGCRRDRTHDCRELARLGCDVLIIDYRGYGDSGGAPSETLLSADARRAWLFAMSELNRPPERIILLGESIGGAVAVRLAAEMSVAGTPPGGLVLNSTFASLPQTVAWHYPAFPFQFLLLDRYPSVTRMPLVTCAVLQFHGTADEFVPLEHGRELFAAAPGHSAAGVPKQFVEIEGGVHNGIPASEMRSALTEFFNATRDTASP